MERSEERIENHQKMTGQPREVLEARYKTKRDMREDVDESGGVQGCDASQRGKFNMQSRLRLSNSLSHLYHLFQD